VHTGDRPSCSRWKMEVLGGAVLGDEVDETCATEDVVVCVGANGRRRQAERKRSQSEKVEKREDSRVLPRTNEQDSIRTYTQSQGDQ